MKSNFLIMSPFHQNIVYRVFIVSKESSDGVHISIKIAKCETVKLFCKQNSNIEYSFQANVAARGYKVYKNITWEETKCGDKVLNGLETDEKATNYGWSTPTIKHNGTYSREISRYVYFFLNEEKGQIHGTVLLIIYLPSPIPVAGLEIPLILNFKSPVTLHI